MKKTKEDFEYLVGKTIRIIELADPYDKYRGRVGTVLGVGEDAWHDVYLSGTWGGVNVYPEVDTYEIIED